MRFKSASKATDVSPTRSAWPFCLGITKLKMPKVQGRDVKYNSFNEECAKRRCIISNKNKDNLCLPRALVVGKAFVDTNPELKRIRLDMTKWQEKRAREYIEVACVSVPVDGAVIPKLQQFQNFLKHYKIVVYSYGCKSRDVIFEGVGVGPKLNMLHSFIRSILLWLLLLRLSSSL